MQLPEILIVLQILNLGGVGGILKYFFNLERRLSRMEGYCRSRSDNGEDC